MGNSLRHIPPVCIRRRGPEPKLLANSREHSRLGSSSAAYGKGEVGLDAGSHGTRRVWKCLQLVKNCVQALLRWKAPEFRNKFLWKGRMDPRRLQNGLAKVKKDRTEMFSSA